jgi:AbrB family looped-hinge helix DNA binding protein
MNQKKFYAKLHDKDRMYGTTTMGARGQVVIPAEARKELGLKPGDRMLVMGKFGKVLGLMKADEIESFISLIMDKIDDRDLRAQFATQARKFIKYSQSSKS